MSVISLKKKTASTQEDKMKHYCAGLKEMDMRGHDKPPHWLSLNLQDAPDETGEVVFTVLYYYRDKESPVSLGWGMRWSYCPACGKKLKSGNE